MLIGPFGMSNKAPVFWTRKCKILQINYLKGNHIKMLLDDGTSIIEAIKWNFSTQLKVNDLIDVAFNIEINKEQYKVIKELDVVIKL